MGREDDGSLSDRHADLAAEHLCKCLHGQRGISLRAIVDQHIGVSAFADGLLVDLNTFVVLF
jgi:hypothetical protein